MTAVLSPDAERGLNAQFGTDSPPTSRGRRIIANTAANAILNALQLGVGLLTFPYLLRHFGRDAYGVYALLVSVQAFLQLLSLGLVASLMRFVPEHMPVRDRFERLIGTAYWLAGVSNGVITLVLIAVALGAPHVLGLSPREVHLYRELTWILAIATIPNGMLGVPRGVLSGLERIGLRAALETVGVVSPILAIVVVHFFGIGFGGYLVITYGGLIFSGVFCLHATRALLPDVRQRPRLDRQVLRELGGFNVLLIANQAADLLFFTTDRIVLQRVRGAAVVAEYAVADRMNTLAGMIVTVPLAALLPAAARLHAAGDARKLSRLVATGTRLYTALILPPLVVLLVFMRPLLERWIGPSYGSLALAAQLFVLSTVVTVPLKVTSYTLLATGRQAPLVLSKILYAPLNVVASIFLARRFGIVGVIIPTLAYFAAVYPVVLALMVRRFELDPGLLARSVRRTILAVAGGTAVPVAARLIAGPVGWLGLAAVSALSLTLFYGLVLCFGLTHDDRAHALPRLPSPRARLFRGPAAS